MDAPRGMGQSDVPRSTKTEDLNRPTPQDEVSIAPDGIAFTKFPMGLDCTRAITIDVISSICQKSKGKKKKKKELLLSFYYIF
jgi:hypothetical protein